MEPEKFIKDNLGELIQNPKWTEWLKMQPPTAALAKATIGDGETVKTEATREGEAAAPSTMDKIKATATDKKFLGGAGIGFLAGAATGAAITHVVHKKKNKKKKKKRGSSSSSSSSSDSDY